MTNNDKTGGAAFPSKDIKLMYPKDDFPPEVIAKLHEIRVEQPGMTLLDYFAGQALIAILLAPGREGDSARNNPDRASAWSYDQATSMLTERTRRQNDQTS